MIKTIGAQGNIKNVEDFLEKISDFAKKNNVIIQAFNAELIYGKDHIISSVNHAKRALNQKTNTTNSLEKEILLYASAERQLKLAIPKIGVKKGNTKIAFVFINKKKNISIKKINEFLKILTLYRNDKVLEGEKNTLKKFGIKENEIKTVNKSKYGHLILEKIAMIDIIK